MKYNDRVFHFLCEVSQYLLSPQKYICEAALSGNNLRIIILRILPLHHESAYDALKFCLRNVVFFK